MANEKESEMLSFTTDLGLGRITNTNFGRI
jgi:hypothetical protein